MQGGSEVFLKCRSVPLYSESFKDQVPPVSPNVIKGSCPLLDPEQGCMLGKEKPFCCSIWPVQIMEIEGKQAITLSPLCKAVLQQPFEEILTFVRSELAEVIFAYADAHPEEVLPYDGVSPILLWK